MPGGSNIVISGTADVSRIEAPVTVKAYLICAFAAFYTGLPYPNPNDAAAVKAFAVSSRDASLVTSILSAGTFFGALAGGDIADLLGRKPTIILGCLIFTVGCILETASTGLGLMTPGRLIAGLGVGFISTVVILYMSEICPRKVRGALVSCYQFCITIGILLANCVVYATQDRNDTGSYRIPIAIQFLWALILGTGLCFLPESPRYLVKRGRLEEAATALSRVRGQPINSEYVSSELAEIVANWEYEQTVIPQTSYIGGWTNCLKGSIFKGNSNLRRTMVGAFLQMFQQFTGINFILYFGVVFFKQLGTISNPFLIQLITTLVNVLSTPVSFWIVERFGRRSILIVGGTSMVICQFIVAIIGVTAGRAEENNQAAVKAMIAFICLNISAFAMTWGPSAWVVVGELFPLPIRARGVGISTSSNWFWNCIIAVISPYLYGTDPGDANLGAKVFFVWGSTCALSTLFAFFFVPEMSGLTLEQVDKMLEEVSPMRSAGWKPSTTFAEDVGLVGKGLSVSATAEEVHEKVDVSLRTNSAIA